MIRPSGFGFNQQTADSNAFQHQYENQQEVAVQARAEFDEFVAQLRANQVEVLVFEDTETPETPDAVFPNNWVSFHEDGQVFLYPMQAPNRRLERRADIIDNLKTRFDISTVTDLSAFENEGIFLEGTGSMVFNRRDKLAYACLSPRTHPKALERFSELSGYKIISFNAVDEDGKPIYHTNVMMCMGDTFVVICLDAIASPAEKETLMASFTDTKKRVVSISHEQMNAFAGNMLQVSNQQNECLLVLSARAYQALQPGQTRVLLQHCRILPVNIHTIEDNGGGSARCMLAEVNLPALK